METKHQSLVNLSVLKHLWLGGHGQQKDTGHGIRGPSFNSSSESEDPRSCHLILPSLFHHPSDWDPSPCSSHPQSKDRTCRRAFHNREAPCMHTVVAFRPSLLGKDSLPEAVTLLGVVSSDRTDSMRDILTANTSGLRRVSTHGSPVKVSIPLCHPLPFP